MDKLRVGLIGIGGMGFCHYNCYKKIESAQLAAVCDVRSDMALEKTGGSVKIYTDFEEMARVERLDMVDICTPSYLHADMAIKCLDMGLHVLCEKPMTLTGSDADRLLKVADGTDKNFMVAHVVRFMRPYAYLRETIKKGELGRLLRLDMKRISSIPKWSWEDWMRDESKSGGVVTDLSIHDFDFVQSVLGKPDDLKSYYRPIAENSSFSIAQMRYGNTLVTCESGWYNADIPFNASYYAVFDNGYIDFKDGKVYRNKEEVSLGGKAAEELGINIKSDDAYQAEIEYFIGCSQKGVRPDFVSPASSADSVRLSDEIKRNAVKL